jgi:hypothetical protein
MQAKVGEPTQIVRDRERELEQKEDQVAKDRNLLEHDQDLRESIESRDLCIAEIHNVSAIDAVFVTVEPNGGSQHPRGKQLLFAYLRTSPNHPEYRNSRPLHSHLLPQA